MGLQAQDTLGWTVQDDPNQYRGDFNIKKKVGTVNSNINAIVVTNKANGQHSVYEDNGALEGLGTELYSYNPDGNQVTIKSKDDFDAAFTGINANQFDTVLKNTKKATLSLAKQGVQTNDPQSRANLTRLVNTIGFRSLGANEEELDNNETNASLQSTLTETTNRPNALLTSFAVGGRRETLRYPRQSLEEYGYDYISITAFDYVPSGLQTGKKLKTGFKGGNKRFKDPSETIQLPMQPQLSESTSVNWGNGQLNAIQANLARLVGNSADALSSGNIGAAGAAVGESFNDMMAMAKDPRTKAAVKAYFAGQAVGVNNLASRQEGQVINPNLELLFTGPNLRQFNFNFTLTPRDPEEARVVRRIIRAMKRNMTPQRSPTALFLLTPRVFELEYIFGDTNREHPFLNKFKPCACTNFAVNYTPDGSYMTYRGEPSMTAYQLTMSFGEIEPIYADEYKNDNNMGF